MNRGFHFAHPTPAAAGGDRLEPVLSPAQSPRTSPASETPSTWRGRAAWRTTDALPACRGEPRLRDGRDSCFQQRRRGRLMAGGAQVLVRNGPVAQLRRCGQPLDVLQPFPQRRACRLLGGEFTVKVVGHGVEAAQPTRLLREDVARLHHNCRCQVVDAVIGRRVQVRLRVAVVAPCRGEGGRQIAPTRTTTGTTGTAVGGHARG